MDAKLFLVAKEFGAQHRNQVPVQFDGIQRAGFFQQLLGEGTQTGADLHQMLPGPGVDRPEDAANDAGVVEEVLAKALAGAVHHRFLAHRLFCFCRLAAMRLA